MTRAGGCRSRKPPIEIRGRGEAVRYSMATIVCLTGLPRASGVTDSPTLRPSSMRPKGEAGVSTSSVCPLVRKFKSARAGTDEAQLGLVSPVQRDDGAERNGIRRRECG